MGSSFKVELEELEAVRLKLQGLIQDHFQAQSSPLAPNTYHNNTASDLQHTAAPAGVKRAEQVIDPGTSNFGPTNQGIDAIWKLNNAHNQVQQAVYGLIGDVNQKIADLHDRVQRTYQQYQTTETNLHLDMTQIQKDA
jgi:hypothetical protein